jgi:uncharacterized protein YndB with AHSA1/START domain
MSAGKENPSDRSLTVTRLLNAPLSLVWDVWSRPEHITQWWGPTGFTDTNHEMDFSPGGYWRHTMHGPDGTDYPNEARFKEIVKHERIVYQHFKPDFTATVEFTAEGTRTHIRWTMLFESKEVFEMVVSQHKADKGLVQNVDKMEAYLRSDRIVRKELTITRTIDAPLSLVWQAWTDEKQLAQWWGPKGFINPVCEWQAQANGKIYIEMKAPDGTIYPMDGVICEVTKTKELVFTCGALDANGERLFDILNTITFHEENGKTNILLHFIVSNIKPEGERYIAGQEMGWNMSLDKLNHFVNPKK